MPQRFGIASAPGVGEGGVAVLFSGGPAPAANAVISSLALALIRQHRPVFGFLSGFEHLECAARDHGFTLMEGKHFLRLDDGVSSLRNQRGVCLGTSRANPGKGIRGPRDLEDEEKTRALRGMIQILRNMGVVSLVTIGGDDTLKTANYLQILGMPTLHIPKTIDNDYYGIAWTFGYWSAVQACQESLLNLRADAQSTGSYFIVELMGRKAGWLTYASGLAGEAVMMISGEDLAEGALQPDILAERVVDLMLRREQVGKAYGVVAIAEGLADLLPDELRPRRVDRNGNLIMGDARVGDLLASAVASTYQRRTGRTRKVLSRQIGYETRNAPPCAFDVVLGSMLGFGAARLLQEGVGGRMISVTDDFSIRGVPYEELIDPVTLKTRLRKVERGSDFFELKESLSFPMDPR